MKEYCSRAEIYADLQDQLEVLKNIRIFLAETAQSIRGISEICSDCMKTGITLGTDIGFSINDLRVIITMGQDAYNAAEALTQFVEVFDNNITVSQEAINQINNQ